jgi:uncharacterized damage-inducible protein DinB
MLTETLIKLFNRDLSILKLEIEAYSNEKNLWLIDYAIKNSAGNLCLHLIGNLKHFVGHDLGGTDYIRQRDLEFSLKNVPRIELLKQIDETMFILENTLKGLTEIDLQKEFKRRVFEETMTTEYFLVHLSTHLTYHLGQINYHRRLLDH